MGKDETRRPRSTGVDERGTTQRLRETRDRERLRNKWTQAQIENRLRLSREQAGEWTAADTRGQRGKRRPRQREDGSLEINPFVIRTEEPLRATDLNPGYRRTSGEPGQWSALHGNPFERRPLAVRVLSLIRRNEVKKALGICRRQLWRKPVEARTFLDLLFVLGRGVSLAAAGHLYKHVDESSWMNNYHRQPMIEAMLRLSAERGDQQAFDMWTSRRKQLDLPESTYAVQSELLLSAARGDHSTMRSRWSRLQDKPELIDEPFMGKLVELLCQRRDTEGLQDALGMMRSENMIISADAYRHLMSLFEGIGDVAAAEPVFANMMRSTVRLAESPFLSMLRLKLASGDLEGVYSTYQSMLSMNVRPGPASCSVLNEACTKAQDRDLGERLLCQLVKLRLTRTCGEKGCDELACRKKQEKLGRQVKTLGRADVLQKPKSKDTPATRTLSHPGG